MIRGIEVGTQRCCRPFVGGDVVNRDHRELGRCSHANRYLGGEVEGVCRVCVQLGDVGDHTDRNLRCDDDVGAVVRVPRSEDLVTVDDVTDCCAQHVGVDGSCPLGSARTPQQRHVVGAGGSRHSRECQHLGLTEGEHRLGVGTTTQTRCVRMRLRRGGLAVGDEPLGQLSDARLVEHCPDPDVVPE